MPPNVLREPPLTSVINAMPAPPTPAIEMMPFADFARSGKKRSTTSTAITETVMMISGRIAWMSTDESEKAAWAIMLGKEPRESGHSAVRDVEDRARVDPESEDPEQERRPRPNFGGPNVVDGRVVRPLVAD